MNNNVQPTNSVANAPQPPTESSQDSEIRKKTNNDPEIIQHSLDITKNRYFYVIKDDKGSTTIPTEDYPESGPIIEYWRKNSRYHLRKKEYEERKKEKKHKVEPPPQYVPPAPVVLNNEDPIEILGIVSMERPIKFAVKFALKDIQILNSIELKKKYPAQLSQFYEKNLTFVQT